MDPLQNQNNAGNVASGEKKSFGPIIGIIVIILVLGLGALYFWGGTVSDQDLNTAAPVSESDEISSIEEDLSVGGDFEADFSDIEADLEAESSAQAQ